MDVEREQLIEIGVSMVAVSIMFVLLYMIGVEFYDNGELTERGGEMLVYAIIGFIFLMSGTGVVLAYLVSSGDEA